MTVITPLALAVSLLCSGAALAYDVNKAVPQFVSSSGLGGASGAPGCLFLGTDLGNFTLPFVTLPPPAMSNEVALNAAARILTNPPHGTVSFNIGPPNPGVCRMPGWEAAPTIKVPSSP